jgi:hypothetical protein
MIEKNPLICPRCQSKQIDYCQDSATWFSQWPAEGGEVEVSEGAAEYFDTLLEASCRTCKFRDSEPSFTAWRGL